MFCRNGKDESIKNYVKKIEKGLITKKALYRSFFMSEEYHKKKIFSMINLTDDPFEEKEILPTNNLGILQEYANYLPSIFDLEVKN